MPARSKVTDQQIYDALSLTGGAVAAAAHLLKVSPRTLQRRMKANSDLRPYPAQHPSFDLAWHRVADSHNQAENACLFGTSGVLMKKFTQDVKWDEADVELEPERLEGNLLREFLAKLQAAEPMMVTVRPSALKAARRRSGPRHL